MIIHILNYVLKPIKDQMTMILNHGLTNSISTIRQIINKYKSVLIFSLRFAFPLSSLSGSFWFWPKITHLHKTEFFSSWYCHMNVADCSSFSCTTLFDFSSLLWCSFDSYWKIDYSINNLDVNFAHPKTDIPVTLMLSFYL